MTERAGLTPMTRIEVIVSASDVTTVGDVLTACGATGFTVLSGVSGLGHHGFHQGRLHFNDQDTLRLVLTVIDDAHTPDVVAGIRALLADRPGVLFVSDTYVSRPEYFT